VSSFDVFEVQGFIILSLVLHGYEIRSLTLRDRHVLYTIFGSLRR
jgi:hypothetical protein